MLGRTQPWDDWDTHYRLFVPSHRHRAVIRPDLLLLIGRCSDWYTVKGEGCSSKNVTLSWNICSSLRHVLDLRPRALHYLCLDLNVKFGIKSAFAPPPSAPECPGISAVQIWNAILRLLFVKCNYLCCEPTANCGRWGDEMLWEINSKTPDGINISPPASSLRSSLCREQQEKREAKIFPQSREGFLRPKIQWCAMCTGAHIAHCTLCHWKASILRRILKGKSDIVDVCLWIWTMWFIFSLRKYYCPPPRRR